ncbi:MAG TPA: HypC/HybG/HupF family hydrogenase formation chaperone [Rubrobacter sp.]|nr:HypC/HybG/HupF family hydrogenase formation chaperone [Rubrobacter sp.]
MKDDLTLLENRTLDHDGCVVCSDAGIPVRVISIEGDDALCEDSAGNQTEIAIELVASVQIGEVLLTHGGVAIGKVETKELTADS